MATPVLQQVYPLHGRAVRSGSPPQGTKAKRAGQKPLLDIRNIHSPLAEEFCVDTQLRKKMGKKSLA